MSRTDAATSGVGGFTLIEMMVVVAIIGVLAAMLSPMVGKVLGDTKKAKAQTETRAIADAIAMYKQYYEYYGNYPLGVCGGCGVCGGGETSYNYARDDGGTGCGATVLSAPLVEGSPRFLSKRIDNDPWGRPYSYHIYTLSSACPDMAVYSSGPDKTNSTWSCSTWDLGRFNGDDIGAIYDEKG